jgi:hypothetical protein
MKGDDQEKSDSMEMDVESLEKVQESPAKPKLDPFPVLSGTQSPEAPKEDVFLVQQPFKPQDLATSIQPPPKE